MHVIPWCTLMTPPPPPPPLAADMLAWVHASLASEQEFLVSLFGGDASQEGGGAGAAAAPAQRQQPGSGGGPPSPHAPAVAAGEATSPADGAPTIPQLLDSVFESICRPLKVGAASGLAAGGAAGQQLQGRCSFRA